MNKSESIAELAKALAKAQGSMGGASKAASNPFFKSKYADLAEVVRALKDEFAENGLSYAQFPLDEGDRIGVETVLMHESGEWMSSKFTVQLTKNDAQGAGAAITYCRRYALQAIAGIPAEDDDGNAAVQRTTNNKENKVNISSVEKTAQELINALSDDERSAIGFWRSLAKKGQSYQEKVYNTLDRDIQKEIKKLSALYPVNPVKEAS